MFVDTHAHLDFPELYPRLPSVLANARIARVNQILTIGIDGKTNRQAVQIAKRHASVSAAVGWHPHEAERADAALEDHIRSLASEPKVVAIGEIGLDYFRDRSLRSVQRDVFRRMLTIAQELDLPIIVHCREAADDVLNVIGGLGRSKLRGVFHCFAGDESVLRQVLKLGFYVSYTGNVTYKNSSLLPVVEATPMERLLLETDCPFMTPYPHRGKKVNEPAYIPLIAERIAEIKKLSLADVARITSVNAYKLFGVGTAPQPTFVYPIRNSLYIALTSRCTNHCSFCPRDRRPEVKGHYIGMTEEQEPSVAAVITAIGDPTPYDEVVFCGFGEPTLRLAALLEVGRWLKAHGAKQVRLNTNGQANLIYQKDITLELIGVIDSVSISLNERQADLYQSVVRSDFGEESFTAVLDFARHCVALLPETILSVVACPGVDIEAVGRIAHEIGAKFRVRAYNELG